ncbi:hypothetical protein [Lactococcus petauri]|uniref:hypothetical protein n=1 Tax=Lactococcus petauri TaxID=1940789 RepID=UPI0021D4BC19|nr:hypothetical protein [Lactococcus petauri]MCU7363641.1 hypothetical protein [Lactococcus petauri]MDA3734909.1 hypothetical protein [Lactococcus petauri]MDC7842338.1 hypothetical protein [Lactococcus petauri]
MKSRKNAFIRFWYTLVLVANQKEHSDAELLIITANGTYIGKPVPSSELEESFVNQAWKVMLEEEKLDGMAEEISLVNLKDVRKADGSEKYESLTIFAEDIIGISGNGDLSFPSED